jgi:diguanylate cyclase (GGDEF)-like protein
VSDIPEHPVSLLDAARVVARGGDLDARLRALVSQAHGNAQALAVVVYLVDATGERLVPMASEGSPEPEPATIDLSGAPEIATAALVRRQTQLMSTQEATAAFGGLAGGARTVAAVPLVATDLNGDPEVEGLLVVALDEGAIDIPEPLLALADLAAVTIRQARLENTLHEHADWLDRVANTDSLTGLANRATFDRMLQLELARASRQGTPVGLALFAVDGLDIIAGRDGAGASDDVLRNVAATLADQLRLIDTVARIEPSVFAAICPGSSGPEAASRVREAVAQPQVSTVSADLPVTVTAAVASYPEDGAEADAVVSAAMSLLEQARATQPGGVAQRHAPKR